MGGFRGITNVRVALHEPERRWLISKQTASIYVQKNTAQLCT